jgi:hypothetical protein
MAPGGAGFAATIDSRVTVEEAASRLHQQMCATASSAIASARPGTSGATPPNAAGGTKLRFDMTQNGKRMTADEFDAWMKAQGVRVVKAQASAAPAPATAPAAPASSPPPKKRKP